MVGNPHHPFRPPTTLHSTSPLSEPPLPSPLPHALIAASAVLAAACHAPKTPVDAPPDAAGPPAADVSWTTPDAEVPRVRQLTFDSEAAGAPVSLHVFVPEPYDRAPERRWPVLYYLHGHDAGTTGIRPLTAGFAQAMQRGDMPLALVVFPYGHEMSLWIDSMDGRVPMETVVVQEIVPLIDATFRTHASPEGRLVEGYSMGGYGAARYGIAHADVFGAFSVLAGGPLQPDFTEGPRTRREARDRLLDELFGGDMANFYQVSPWNQAEVHAARLQDGRPIQIAVGARDELRDNNRAFSARLTDLGIDHDYVEIPGVDHDAPALLQGMGEARWAFYRRALTP